MNHGDDAVPLVAGGIVPASFLCERAKYQKWYASNWPVFDNGLWCHLHFLLSPLAGALIHRVDNTTHSHAPTCNGEAAILGN